MYFCYSMETKNTFNANDVQLLNTERDRCNPDEFFGRYHLHILCRQGNMLFMMNGIKHQMGVGDFVIWQIGSELSDVIYSEDFVADFLILSPPFLIKYNPERIWATKAFVYIKNNPVFHLNDEGLRLCNADFRLFAERLSERNHLFQDEVVGSTLQMFFYDLWQIYSCDLMSEQRASNSAAEIFQRFITLVSQHAFRERKISFYSDRLFVSPKYLSEVSRSFSEKPASDWITGYAVQEMQAMLKNPELTLIEISYRMNFPNYSNFTKYAKANIAMSPTEYRKKISR